MKRMIEFLLILICVFTTASCSNKNVDSLQDIKGQELINEVISSDERYLIKAYKNNGGVTVDYSVLCTLTDNQTKKTNNIYWQYKLDEVIIEWIDNDTVSINDVILNLPEDTYDWRMSNREERT